MLLFWVSSWSSFFSYLGQVAMRLCPSCWCWCCCGGGAIIEVLYDGVGSDRAGVDSTEKSGCLIVPRRKVPPDKQKHLHAPHRRHAKTHEWKNVANVDEVHGTIYSDSFRCPTLGAGQRQRLRVAPPPHETARCTRPMKEPKHPIVRHDRRREPKRRRNRAWHRATRERHPKAPRTHVSTPIPQK